MSIPVKSWPRRRDVTISWNRNLDRGNPPLRTIIAAVFLFALGAGTAGAVTFDEARHLLARTGFGVATPAEISALMPLDYTAAVDRLLDGMRSEPVTSPPPWLGEKPPPPKVRKAFSEAERRAFNGMRRERGREMKRWWLGEMLATDSPLSERMVLFWHNHFVSSLKKVKWPNLLYAQTALFRRHAMGNFGGLLRRVARDPAMLLYLDGNTNRKGRPNENFARELLELFTLGEGRGYTEDDIREAARAFTGWTLNGKTGEPVFRRKRHDAGIKTFLGHRGPFIGDDILAIILKHPAVAEHLTEKLWREFVSPTPDPAEVKRLAALFRESDLHVRTVLRAILVSAAFRDPAVRGALIKSPVDLAVGTVRLLDLRPDDLDWLPWMTRRLGQDILDPPNVKGWPGGFAWITTASLPARRQFLGRVSRGAEMTGGKKKTMSMTRVAYDPMTALGGGSFERMRRVVLPLAPANNRNPKKFRDLLLDPVYQLK
jgi:uncharacterized protein (DUF1800 family)